MCRLRTVMGTRPCSWPAIVGTKVRMRVVLTLWLYNSADVASSNTQTHTHSLTHSHTDLALALIKAGAELNARDTVDGATPLQVARREKLVRVVYALQLQGGKL